MVARGIRLAAQSTRTLLPRSDTQMANRTRCEF